MHEGSRHQHLTGANAGVGEPLAVPNTRICEYRACLRCFVEEPGSTAGHASHVDTKDVSAKADLPPHTPASHPQHAWIDALRRRSMG
jgi:hypothetical protein